MLVVIRTFNSIHILIHICGNITLECIAFTDVKVNQKHTTISLH